MKLALVQIAGSDIDRFRETSENLLRRVDEACENEVDFILLPECAYPAYFIGLDPEQESLRGTRDFLDSVAQAAKRHSVYIAAGAAVEDGDALYNSVVVFGPDGETVGRADKSNLWHFDGKWFRVGEPGFVFDTPFGRIGVMVCADGRIPEIARMLRLRGARLILDAVNLVANARVPEELSNQQYRFLLQTRALENGVPIAVSNKTGVESGGVTFMGRSFIVIPDGGMPAQCTPDREEILYWDVELPALAELPRRPELYALLAEDTQKLPVTGIIRGSYELKSLEMFTAVARFDPEQPYLAQAARCVHVCAEMDAQLIVLPPAPETVGADEAVEACRRSLPESAVAALCVGKAGHRRALLIGRDGVRDVLHETHGEELHPIKTAEIFPGNRVAALFGDEMMIPEAARVAMLQGADLLLWFDGDGREHAMKLLETRAAENKIFTLRSTGAAGGDSSLIVNPDGAVLCTTFEEGEHYTAGIVHTSQSKSKEVVPGTNVVTGRIPHFYKELTKE